MFTIDINISGWRLIIDSDSLLDDKHTNIGRLLFYLLELNNTVPISEFLFKKQIDGDFKYEITASDARYWKQIIHMGGSSDTTEMNFEVEDFWKLPEFSKQRAIRDLVVHMTIEFQIDRIKMTFS